MAPRSCPCPSMMATLCSKTRSVSSRCRCPLFPKLSGSSNTRKGSSPISSTRPTTKRTWVLYLAKSTTIPKACRSNEPLNSNDGMRTMIPTMSSISKTNSWPIANPTSCSSKEPVKSFAKNSKRSADSTH